jgi:hypothetical protein
MKAAVAVIAGTIVQVGGKAEALVHARWRIDHESASFTRSITGWLRFLISASLPLPGAVTALPDFSGRRERADSRAIAP